MPRVHRASRPVTMGCFCHSFPGRVILASGTVSCWDPHATLEIKMGSASVDAAQDAVGILIKIPCFPCKETDKKTTANEVFQEGGSHGLAGMTGNCSLLICSIINENICL